MPVSSQNVDDSNKQRIRVRGKFWLWTTYNVDVDTDQSVYKFDESVQFAQWQLEKTERSEKLQHQGFIETKETRCLSSVKKFFPPNTRVKVVRKLSAAEAYLRKLKTRVSGPWSFGVKSSTSPFLFLMK